MKDLVTKKEIPTYGTRTVSKNVLKEIPSNSSPRRVKSCPECKWGDSYTVRIRVRAGRTVYVNTGTYDGEKYKTKQQIQIIVGSVCTDCGFFDEDPDFKKIRIKKLRLYAKDGYGKERYQELLDKALSKERLH